MPAAGVITIIVVLLIVLVLVVYLVSTILALRTITAGLDEAIRGVGELVEKSAPVNDVVTTINEHLDAGVDLLEGLLVKKAGLKDAVGLVDGLYPGAAAAGLRNFPESRTINAPRISEVYTKGTLTLARLGREAPIAAASPEGPVLRNVLGGSLAARSLYPEVRQTRPANLGASPVIGTGAPVQYDPDEEVGGPRRQMPAHAGAGLAPRPGSGAGAAPSPGSGADAGQPPPSGATTAVAEPAPSPAEPAGLPPEPDPGVIRWKKDA